MRIGHIQGAIRANDWLVQIQYVDFAGREKTRTIGVHRVDGSDMQEQEAIILAINSLRKSMIAKNGRADWVFPPEIKDCSARLRYEIGLEKTVGKVEELAKRFARK